ASCRRKGSGLVSRPSLRAVMAFRILFVYGEEKSIKEKQQITPTPFHTAPHVGLKPAPHIAAPAHPCARGIPYILYIKKPPPLLAGAFLGVAYIT
ncbi:MAG: hypothetical protein ACI9W6_001794, partial [Motiliproteus sp.]